jgi:hypothetical protein
LDSVAISTVLAKPISAELLTSPSLARLAYAGLDGFPRVVPVGFLWKEQVRATSPRMARISIEPQWARLIDFETTLPQAGEELVRARAGRQPGATR